MAITPLGGSGQTPFRGLPAAAFDNPIARALSGLAPHAAGRLRESNQANALIEALAGPGQQVPAGAPQPAPGTPTVARPGGMQTGQAGVMPQSQRSLIEALAGSGLGREALTSIAAQQLVPPEPESFTLSPGEVRFQGGQPVAAGGPDMPNIAREMLAFGLDPRNPEDQQKFFELQRQPGTTVNVDNAPKLPAAPQGQQYVPDPNATGGYRLEPIVGFEPEMSGPAATIASVVPGGLEDLGDISGALLDPQTGNVDRDLLATMNPPGLGMAVPGTRGAELRSSFDGALDTMVRIRTGAAATRDEIQQMRSTYMPSPLDTPETVRDKLRRLDRDMRRALETAGRGRGQQSAGEPLQMPEQQPTEERGVIDRVLQGVMEFVPGFGGGEGGEQATEGGEAQLVTSPDQYNQLPAGSLYRDESGNVYRKRR